MAPRDEEGRDVPRLGADPFDYDYLRELADKPWDISIDDLTIALNLTWNQMYEMRAAARILLRQKTGHRADTDKKDWYKKHQELLVWMEERPSGASIDCLHLNIYTRFMEKFPQFYEPYCYDANGSLILVNGRPQKDMVKMAAKEQDDPCGIITDRKIAKAPQDMLRVFAMAIIHFEMTKMKKNPLLRSAATEGQFKWRCVMRSAKDKLDPSAPTPGGRKRKRDIGPQHEQRNLVLYDYESENPEADCVVTPPLSSMLPKRWPDAYPREQEFPLLDLVDEKLWREVAKLMGVAPESWRDVRRDGWLRYVHVPAAVEAEQDVPPQDWGQTEGARIWNVKNGAQLGKMVEIHCDLNSMAPSALLCLTYIRGAPGEGVELGTFVNE